LCVEVQNQLSASMPGAERAYNFASGADANPPQNAFQYLMGSETNDHINSGTTECAGSFHEGGCHYVYVDGSVRFLSENIAEAPWRAMSTRAGGEVVDYP
jgi:prepilin-type processing-associated H-X9-DG protein